MKFTPFLFDWYTNTHREIREEKSISEEVKNLTSIIVSMLEKSISQNTVIRYEKPNDIFLNQSIPYIEDDKGLVVNVPPFENIHIMYKVYLLDSASVKFNQFSRYAYNQSGCETDFEKGFIRVVTMMEDGELYDDFSSEIQHEASHWYQSFMGQTKNENLYTKIVNTIKSDNTSMNEKNVARALYYTFPSEQDAFVNQFYAYLIDNFSEQPIQDFSQALQYSVYRTFRTYANSLIGINQSELIEILQSFGMTINRCFHLLNKADKRFYRKLSNAFQKYKIDLGK